MDEEILRTFDRSLERCTASNRFFDRFYERFLDSSPTVRGKFAGTDFARQKRALRASLHMMLLAAQDGEERLDHHLGFLARRHGRSQLDVTAELYGSWLESLLATVEEFDDLYGPEVEQAWRRVMELGIDYMLEHYENKPSAGADGAGA